MIDPRRPRYALLLAIIVCMVPFLIARCEAFVPCFDTSSGPIRLRMVTSPLPWLECAAIAGQLGAHADALLMAASPGPACAVWSAGRGWIVAVPGVADWIVGREARHVFDAARYVLPGVAVFGECD